MPSLLLAIADICVEDGEDTAAPFEIRTQKIAEKFINYYWPQVRSYEGIVLRQNTGNMAAVIGTLWQIAARGIVELSQLTRDRVSWTNLVHEVDRVVRDMPLWKLQTVVDFPWSFSTRTAGGAVPSNSGQGSCSVFVVFTNWLLISFAPRGSATSGGSTGTCSARRATSTNFYSAPLDKYLPSLREAQEARCLYCEREVALGSAHIDHFIPWSRYPIDLGHNFVLAHGQCNTSKADHLAAWVHLERWMERNRRAGEHLRERLDSGYIAHNAETSERIARWAYSQAAAASGMVWLRRDEFEPINESYFSVFATPAEAEI